MSATGLYSSNIPPLIPSWSGTGRTPGRFKPAPPSNVNYSVGVAGNWPVFPSHGVPGTPVYAASNYQLQLLGSNVGWLALVAGALVLGYVLFAKK